VVGENAQGAPTIENRANLAAMEYRYDGGRQRYMVRQRHADTLLPPASEYHRDLNWGLWTDYLGETAYGDYRHR